MRNNSHSSKNTLLKLCIIEAERVIQMPLREIRIISPDASLGIWITDETLVSLESQFPAEVLSSSVHLSLPTEKRKMEWLTTRLLIKELLQTDKFSLEYLSTGKPFLEDDEKSISISHSEKYTAVLISKTGNTGIDIQTLKHDIVKGSYYFLSDKEVKQIGGTDKNLAMHVYWCAKEVLIKYFNASGIDFKSKIYIEPFSFQSKGEIIGKINLNGEQHTMHISYETCNEYVLAYAV